VRAGDGGEYHQYLHDFSRTVGGAGHVDVERVVEQVALCLNHVEQLRDVVVQVAQVELLLAAHRNTGVAHAPEQAACIDAISLNPLARFVGMPRCVDEQSPGAHRARWRGCYQLLPAKTSADRARRAPA